MSKYGHGGDFQIIFYKGKPLSGEPWSEYQKYDLGGPEPRPNV